MFSMCEEWGEQRLQREEIGRQVLSLLSLGRSVGGRRKEEEMSEIQRFSCLGEMQPNKMNVKGNLSCLLVL